MLYNLKVLLLSFVYSYCHVFNETHPSLILGVDVHESAPIAHYTIVYKVIYGLVYDVSGLLVHFDACVDSV